MRCVALMLLVLFLLTVSILHVTDAVDCTYCKLVGLMISDNCR